MNINEKDDRKALQSYADASKRTAYRQPTVIDVTSTSPSFIEDNGNHSWVVRSANAVIVITKAQANSLIVRENNSDEYMVILDESLNALITADRADGNQDEVRAKPASLTIVPPGNSRIETQGEGIIVRCFSARQTELLKKAINADQYSDGAPECAPLSDWPSPVGGFKLRHYDLQSMQRTTFAHIIRSSNMMFSSMMINGERRKPSALSPHSHQDFEQFSIAMKGVWIHHLRTPWGADCNEWKADLHPVLNSPSATVIPAGIIHTSQDVGDGFSWLIDIFAPIREDFSMQDGWVLNAEEYPAPWNTKGNKND